MMTASASLQRVELIGIPGIPLVQTGDDLAGLIIEALRASDLALRDGDVLVITSKIVSKSEGRWVDLTTVEPDDEAKHIAVQCGKDPREVAIILSEAESVSRVRQGVLIVRHRLGFVCANGGMDHSNTRPDVQWRLLLPVDPDRTASTIRQRLVQHYQTTIGLIISDSHGRPFRMGTVGVAIGSAGLPALWNLRGKPDLFGTALQVTEVGFADELAAAAGLVLGQSNEGIPAVIIRGLAFPVDASARAADLVRPRDLDLYR
jgi:coenzyme F420-0:L-glutamate ligase/coenzyme F420-1:gamma-L-glutamate ligase